MFHIFAPSCFATTLSYLHNAFAKPDHACLSLKVKECLGKKHANTVALVLKIKTGSLSPPATQFRSVLSLPVVNLTYNSQPHPRWGLAAAILTSANKSPPLNKPFSAASATVAEPLLYSKQHAPLKRPAERVTASGKGLG
jgi:hypothetical protein